MHDAYCETCSSIDTNIPDNMKVTESHNKDSTDKDDDYQDDQSDQSKKPLRFYKWSTSDEGKITKISRNLSVNDAAESFKQRIAVLKRHTFTKRTQATAYEVKDTLKQNDLLIYVDYSENYNNKQEIQKACFGHASFSIFTACCYFKDESNSFNKQAITLTFETSNHSRNTSASCLQKVIHFVREKQTHLPLKMNVIVWRNLGLVIVVKLSSVCVIFFLLSKRNA